MIKRLNDDPVGSSIIMLIYGGSGTGKSWICGTAGNRNIIYNLENRRATWESKTFKEKIRANPFIIDISEEPLPDGGAKALDELTASINQIITEMPNEFDTITIDGVTALRRFAMNKGLELNQKLNKSKSLDKNKALNTELGFIDVAVQDFAAEMQLVEKFIAQIIDFCRENKKNLVMTAHERIEFGKPEQLGLPAPIEAIKPGFTGRTFPDAIPGMFDLTWHTECVGSGDQTIYRCRTVGDNKLIAKTCYGGIFKQFESNVKLTEVFKRIREGR